MGLDNYASRTPGLDLTAEDMEAFKSEEIGLGNGPGGFRGKMYQEVVEAVTGVSLYESWIPPHVVRQMWMALERCDPEEAIKVPSRYEHDVDAIVQLRTFFRVCVERNLGLVASF